MRWRNLLKTIAMLIVVALAATVLLIYARFKGPYHDYELDVVSPMPPSDATDQLEVGVGIADLSPPEAWYDTWTDVNGNQQWEPDVDTFEDRDGNGAFDPLWLSGFDNARPASGLAQPLDARAIALRNNGTLIVLVTADMIGIVHNDVIHIREAVDAGLGIDHVLVAATHTHEVPDPIGMWSHPVPFISFDPRYIELVRPRIVEAIEGAVANLEPAEMYCVQTEVPRAGFVRDSRRPDVVDPHLNAFRFVRPGTEETIATLVNWGNHPETLGLGNTRITPDFPYWLRKGLEEGVPEPNGAEGFDAPCLYFQGIVGGLMTPLELTVPHRDGQQAFTADSFEKAQALGENVAVLAAKALRGEAVWKNETPTIAWGAKTLKAPLQPLFKAAVGLGLMHQGYYPGEGAKSEVNVIRIGEVEMLATPGEIYPELVVGGIEALPGRDYEVDPVEVPPLYDVMSGRINLTLGLANDFIGYLIPKSQWDQRAPWVYDDAPQYGEWMSAGPDVGTAVHAGALELLRKFEE
jgi:hypothetical protein